jgi:hypothetical protein
MLYADYSAMPSEERPADGVLTRPEGRRPWSLEPGGAPAAGQASALAGGMHGPRTHSMHVN